MHVDNKDLATLIANQNIHIEQMDATLALVLSAIQTLTQAISLLNIAGPQRNQVEFNELTRKWERNPKRHDKEPENANP